MGSPEVTRDKAAVFDKLLGKRLEEIIDKIGTLGNLSNPYNYTFTEEKWEDAFKRLDASVAALKERAAKGLRDQPLVGTGRRKKDASPDSGTETAPVQSEEQPGDTGTSPSLAETTSALVDEASEAAKQAQREEMERIEKEDVPDFLKKKA
jgi:hypothetical protein